ncbi:unnamed protein product [Pedinophyceae sp. YPF-701]|nr:unnamed protein product [Pedinophyceae sp. YPF-701]
MQAAQGDVGAQGVRGDAPAPDQLLPEQVTTEVVQRYLEENELLIKAIVDHQNQGRLDECTQYQAKLQRNLLFLAGIADAQVSAQATMPRGAAGDGGAAQQPQ